MLKQHWWHWSSTANTEHSELCHPFPQVIFICILAVWLGRLLSTGTPHVVVGTVLTNPNSFFFTLNYSSCCPYSFCELVNSLLEQAVEPAPDLGHLTQGILEVSPPFFLEWVRRVRVWVPLLVFACEIHHNPVLSFLTAVHLWDQWEWWQGGPG